MSDEAPVERSLSPEESGDSHDDPEFGKRSSIGRNLLHMATSQVLTWGLTTVLLVTQPRYLGPAVIGELRLAVSLWAIAQVVIGLGTGQYLTLAIARDRRAGLALVGPVIVLKSIVFVISTAVMGTYVWFAVEPGPFVAIMVLTGISTFFVAMSQTLTASFTGLERMSVIAVSSVIIRLVGTTAAVIILLFGGDVVTMVAALVAAQAIGFGILLWAYRRVTEIRFRGWRQAARPILRGSVVFLGAGAALIVYQQVDTIIIALLVDDDALGWYATADTLFGTLLFPVTIVMGSLFPVIGRLHAHDPDALKALIRRTMRILLVVTVPIGLGTVVVGPGMADLLFGDKFRETGDVLVVFGPVVILTFASVMFGRVAAGTGRQSLWTGLIVVATVLTIPLDLIFVPWADREFSNGAIGGAMAYATTETLMVIVGFWKITPYLLDRTLLDRFVRVALAGAALVAASWPLRDRFILIPIAAGAVAYLAAVLVFRVLDSEERQVLGRTAAKLRLRSSNRS